MKTLICLLLLSFFTTICNSQTTIYGTIAPGDRELGLRLDQRLSNYGLYISLPVIRGNYLYGETYVRHHHKIALGGLKYFRNGSMASVGISYHRYGQYSFIDGIMPRNTLEPFSFEIGIGTRMERFSYALTCDPFKTDFTACFGYLTIKKHVR